MSQSGKKHTGETASLIKTSTVDVSGMNRKFTYIDQKQSVKTKM